MKIAIIGTGGVAEAFAATLSKSSEVDLVVVGRNRDRLAAMPCRTQLLSEGAVDADLYILAVSDSAVREVAESLQFSKEATVVHTAGSVDVSALMCSNTDSCGVRLGVIYPLQSFTPGRKVVMGDVPLLVESLDGENEIIERCANLLSNNLLALSSKVRAGLHLGAVFVSNFVNMMLSATSKIIEKDVDENLQLDIYKPLIEETLAKAFESGEPHKMQTGPAKRGDEITMERHVAMLQEGGNENLIDTYKTISKLIWETSKKM